MVREVVSGAEQKILEFYLADHFRSFILQLHLIKYYLHVLEYFFLLILFSSNCKALFVSVEFYECLGNCKCCTNYWLCCLMQLLGGFTYWPNSVQEYSFSKMEKRLDERSNLGVFILHVLFSAELFGSGRWSSDSHTSSSTISSYCVVT